MWRLPIPRAQHAAFAGCPQAVNSARRLERLAHGESCKRFQSTGAALQPEISPEHTHVRAHPESRQPTGRSSIIVNRKPFRKPHKPRQRHYNPGEILETAIKIYHGPGDGSDPVSADTARFLAGLRDPRLPIVTAQMVLCCAPNLNPNLQRHLPDDSEWDTRLEKLDEHGFHREDVLEWTRILVAETLEEKAQRFLSGKRPRPMFLLNHILKARVPKTISPESLDALVAYYKTWYTSGYGASDGSIPHLNRNATSGQHAQAWTKRGAISRLFELSRLNHPEAVLAIADLAIACIDCLVVKPEPSSRQAQYISACAIFNFALDQLSMPPRRNPYANLSFNWQAIVRLLTYSSGLERPLVTQRQSYRAIRQVLLAIRKSDAERETATTLKMTWPPYRILRNGMEEALPVEEYYSRTVKAGAMMQESGYARELRDIVTDVLGGLAPDGSPTIQTRSTLPVRDVTSHSVWAAQVRATRNPQEAWQAFQHPTDPELRPNSEVYWELLAKIVAKPSNPHHDLLPGEGREIFPFNDLNLSEFEKARLQPPDLEVLTKSMVQAGIHLDQRCLDLLIRHADSVEAAVTYIQRSSLEEMYRERLEEFLRGTDMSTALVEGIPRTTFLAAVDLCCRLQPNRTRNTQRHYESQELSQIHRAVQITRSAWGFDEDNRYLHSAPWCSIMDALARPNIMVSNLDPPENNLEVIRLGGQILREAEARCGLSLTLVESFGRTIQKALQSRLPTLVTNLSNGSDISAMERGILSLFTQAAPTARSTNLPIFANWETNAETFQTPFNIIAKAHEAYKAAWTRVSVSGLGPLGHSPTTEEIPALRTGTVTPSSINNYMRSLAFLGDFEAMAELTSQMIRHLPTLSNAADPKHAKYIHRALCAFRAFAEPVLGEDSTAVLRAALHKQLRGGKCTDGFHSRWPSLEEVSQYTNSDARGHLRDLRTLIQLIQGRRDHNNGGPGCATRSQTVATPAKAQRSWEALQQACRDGWEDKTASREEHTMNETPPSWADAWRQGMFGPGA